MKTQSTNRVLTALLGAVALLTLPVASPAATTGLWNVNSGGYWSTVGNWSGGVPGSAGDTADLSYAITANRTVTNDVSRSIGILNIGNSSSSYTLANSSGITFTFNNNGLGASLSQTNTTASTTISTPIVLADNLNITNNATLTMSGLISGGSSFGLTKYGAGTLVFADGNTSTYSGITTVAAGTLQLGQSGAYGRVGSGSTSIVVGSGATLSFYQGETCGQTISGAGNVTTLSSIGNGYSETLTAANSYTGTTTVNGVGINAPILANSGVNSSIGASANAAANLVIVGSGTLAYTGTTPVTTDRLLTIGTTAAGGTGTIANNAAATTNSLSFTNTGAIAYGTTGQTRSFTLGGSNPGTNTFAPVIGDNGSGAVSFTKAGAGKWTLTAANTYSGPTTISGGTLFLNGSASLPNSSAITVSSGALLDVSGLASPFTLGSAQTLTAGSPITVAAITNINGNYTSAGTNNIAGVGAIGTLTVNGSLSLLGGGLNYAFGTPTSSGLIALTGASHTLTLAGTTVVTPAGGAVADGTYTLISGISSVPSGTAANLAFGTTSSRGTPTASFSVTPPTVTLTVSGATASEANLVWQGTNGPNWNLTTTNWLNSGTGNPDQFYPLDNVTFDDTGVGTNVTLVGALNLGSMTVNSTANNYNFGGSGSLVGGGSLTMNGSSILTLSNANTFVGGTTINAGTVRLANGSALGAGSLTMTAGVLDMNTNSASVLTLTGSTGTSITDLKTNQTTAVTDTLTVNQVVSNTFAGTINKGVSNNIALVKNGPGYLLLTAASTFTGGATVNAGTLEITNHSSADNGIPYTLAQGATLKLGYNNQTYYGPKIIINGNGASDPSGLYVAGGKTLFLTAYGNGLDLRTAPTTVRAYGSGTATLNSGYDGCVLWTESTASGSVIDSTVNLSLNYSSAGGSGLQIQTDAGNNTTAGDLTIKGLITGGNSTYAKAIITKLGTGSLLLTNANNFVYNGVSTLYLQNGSVLLSGGNNRLPATTVLTLGSGANSGTLVLGGTSQTLAGLLVSGTGTANAVVGGASSTSTLVINNAGNFTNTAALGGTGANQNNLALVKQGAGQLNLFGQNIYTGSTTISAGTVVAGSLTNADGATLSVVDVAGTLAATNLALGVSSGSTVSVTGIASGVSAPIVVTNLSTKGTVYLNVSGALQTGVDYPLIKYNGTIGGAGFSAFQLVPGMFGYVSNNTANSSVDVVLSDTNAYPLVWKGNVSTTWDVATTTNWAFNSVPNIYLNNDNVQLDDTAVSTSTNLTLNAAVTPSAVTVTNNALAYTVSGNGALAGSMGLTKYGPNTLTLLTTNTYTGVTTINGGTVSIPTIVSNGLAYGLGLANNNPAGLVLNGGTLAYTGPTNQTDLGLTFGTNGGTIGVSSNLTLNGRMVGTSTLIKTGSGNLILNNGSGYGLTNLIVNAGTLGFNYGNFYGQNFTNNPTILSANPGTTVAVNTVWALGAGGALVCNVRPAFYGSTFALNSSAYLNYLTLSNAVVNGPGQVVAPYYTTAFYTTLADAVGSTWNAPLSLAGSVQLNIARGTAATDLTISGNVVNANGGGLTKTGPGILLLSGNNTYIGNTMINNGTLGLSGSALSPNTPVITLASNATLNISGLTSPVLAGSQTLQGYGTVVGSLQDSPGTTIIPGSLTNAGTLAINGNLTLAGSETLDYALGKTPTSAGGTNNSQITVAGNLTINPGTTININLSQVALAGGAYKLITYTGTLTDNSGGIATAWTVNGYTPSGRVTGIALSTATPGEIDLVVTGSPANLVWQGDGGANIWDVQNTPNWLNGASSDEFFQFDNVLFNDIGSNNVPVDLQADITASSVVVSNNVKNYTFTSTTGSPGLDGVGTLTKYGTATLTILNNNPYTGVTTINAGTLALGDGVSYDGALMGSPIVDNATLDFNVASSQTAATPISGSGTVVQTGSQNGTLTLNAVNSWTGGLNIQSGTTKLGVNYALPGGESVIVANNAQFDFNGINNGSSTTRANSFTIAGAGPDGVSGAIINNGAGIASYASVSNLTLNGDATIGGSGRWDIGPATNSTINGNQHVLTISSSAHQIDLRAQILTNVASIQISGGDVWYESYSQTNAWTATTTNYLSGGATLGIYGSQVINVPIVATNGTIDNQGSGIPVFSGPLDVEGATTLSSGNGSLVFGGTITAGASGAITLAGGNTIAFAGTDTVSVASMGWTTGTVQLGNLTPSGSVPDATITVPSGANFSVNRSDLYTLTNNLTGPGNMWVLGTNLTGLAVNSSASINIGGNLSVGQNAYGRLLIQPGASIIANNVYMGNPNGAGGSDVIQTGGTLLVTNTTATTYPFRIGHWATETSTYTMGGGTVIVMGPVGVGYDGTGSLRQTNGTIYATVDLEVPEQTRSGSGTYALEGGTINIGGSGIYKGNGVIYLGGGTLGALTNWSTSAAMTLTGTNGSTSFNPAGNIITISGALSGPGGLVANDATGLGELSLTAANTYTGPTTVASGTLLLNGSLATNTVLVDSGATLAGIGTIKGSVHNNGTLALGTNGIGTMTISNTLTLGAGGYTTLAINRTAGTNTYGNARGMALASFGGTLTLTSTGGSFVQGDSFLLFSAGSYANNFSATNLPGGLPSGSQWNWNPTTGVLSVVPTGPSGPATIRSSYNGTTLTLTWPAGQGWSLVSQTNSLSIGLGATWTPVTGAGVTDGSATITVDPKQPTVFYKLTAP